jgi:signal transduction histidine kinase/ligand-binding sensor domain-containing protein
MRSNSVAQLRRALTVMAALAFATGAPATAADTVRPLAGYAITSWTDVDGRSFGAVYSIVQDADRFLWIASNAGLLRFDGVRFATWDALADTQLPKAPASSLYVRSDGSLWVGLANGAGLYSIAGRQATAADPKHQLSGSITSISEDKQNTVWVVADSQLYRSSPSGWTQVPLTDPAPGLRVTSVSRRRTGELLVTTTLGVFQQGEHAQFRKLAPGWAWTVDEDVAGALWVTDTVTGFRSVTEQRRPRAGFGRNGYRLIHDRSDNLWLASIGEGLLRITSSASGTPIVERATLQTGSPIDSVQSLLEDREGNLWAGSTVGLHRLTRQKLMSMPNVGLVTTAAAADHGDIWAGTNYGMVRFAAIDRTWQPQRLPGPTVYVTTLLRQADGTLWIGAREGLLRLVHDAFTFAPVPESIRYQTIRSLASDGRDGLWIGDGQRLYHWNNVALETFNRPTAGDTRIAFAFHDTSGQLWISFRDGSVGILSDDRTFREIPRDQFGPAGVRIYSIAEDADRHTMWFGTSEGISRLRDGHVLTLTGARLPSVPIWTIAQDARGSIWADLDWGVVRFAPPNFQQSAETGRLFDYDFYDPNDGLSGAPVTNMASGRTSDGTLWFVRGGALTTVDPVSLDQVPRDAPGPIRIEAATNGGSPFDAHANMTLPANLRRLDVNYTVVALTYPNRVRFRYHLDGFDTSWTDAGTRRSVSYTNLPPRNYTFRVEAETNQGAWQASAPWSFSISPMPYQTWWFDAACGLVLAACAWAAWRFRLRLERQRYAIVLAERARLSREIHDTLLQGMVGMTLRLEYLAQDTAATPTDFRHKILGVRRQLEHYIRDARRSIKNLRAPILETHSLTEALREIGVRTTADTPVSFSMTAVGYARSYPPHVENEILRIAQEAIANAVRHSNATRVHATIGFEAERVVLEVDDDGRGLGNDVRWQTGPHFGIVTMRERAESLGGTLIVGDPDSGAGTRVQAVIPS